MPSSTNWSCGSKVPTRCAVYRLLSNASLTSLIRTQPNHYAVCVARKWHENYLRLFKYLRVEGDRLCVTFSPGHMDTQPPSPQLLALHAACARVVHMSGAAEALDELHHDAEEMTVLALDGSSARLLDHPMSPFATIPEVV